MKWLRWLPLLLILIAVWKLNLSPRVINLDEEQDIADPAVEQMTTANSRDWGGIDRWAFPGLEAWRLVKRLENAGFSCLLPQDPASGGTPLSGIYSINCSQEKSWPLQRRLRVESRIDYNNSAGLLLAATAYSEIKPASWRESFASILRHLHLLEPAQKRISGLVASSTDDLARIVADAMRGGRWDSYRCDDPMQAALCQSTQSVRAEGFPVLPAGAWPVVDIRPLVLQLRAIGFVPLRHAADSESFMALRLEGSSLWVDLQREDLAGQTEKIAIALNPVGATATRLLLDGRSGRREFALAGKPSTYRDQREQLWLFPLIAGAFVGSADELLDEKGRKAIWLYPPAMDEGNDALQRFQKSLGFIDPGFQPLLLTSYMDKLLQENPPEVQLQLQPPLQTADLFAKALRDSSIPALLTSTEANSMMRTHYAGEKSRIARAAWALYLCESYSSGAPFIEAACWQDFVRNDADAAALLRKDLQEQMQIYSSLSAANPVQKRLQRLAMAYSQTAP